jgi:hypothetical protein
MEDIAQRTVDVSGNIISTSKFNFDIDKQFSEIGIRYGFAMDTHLILNSFNSEYKDTWIQYFNDIDLSQNINDVDMIEDCLIEVIQKIVKPNDSFFINALETGNLSHEWIDKLFNLINTRTDMTAATTIATASDDDNVTISIFNKALIEKPIHVRRHLSTTRRGKHVSNIRKKVLAKTRRNGTS